MRTMSPGARPSRVALVASALLLAGCAGYQLAPLPVGHPAHPDATPAPEPPASRTLAYTRSDIPSGQPAGPGQAVRPPDHTPHHAAGGTSETVVGEGEVVATVPNASQVVLEHGEIKGFMEAMTMGYRIDPPSLLAGLNPGDKVRFTIDIQKRAIIKIERLR